MCEIADASQCWLCCLSKLLLFLLLRLTALLAVLVSAFLLPSVDFSPQFLWDTFVKEKWFLKWLFIWVMVMIKVRLYWLKTDFYGLYLHNSNNCIKPVYLNIELHAVLWIVWTFQLPGANWSLILLFSGLVFFLLSENNLFLLTVFSNGDPLINQAVV